MRHQPQRALSPGDQPAPSPGAHFCCAGAAAAGISTDAFSDFVVGYGEIWCANLFSAYLKSIGVNCAFMDTRTVLVGL